MRVYFRAVPNINSTGARATDRSGNLTGLARAPVNGLFDVYEYA